MKESFILFCTYREEEKNVQNLSLCFEMSLAMNHLLHYEFVYTYEY